MNTKTSISVPALRELSVPRPARFTAGARKGRLVMINLWLVLLIFLVILAGRDVDHLRQLATRGQTTLGQMTSKSISRGKSTTYTIRYRFTAENQSFSDSFTVRASAYDSYSPETPITVTYLPGAPWTFEPEIVDSTSVGQRVGGWSLGIFFGLGFFGMIFGIVTTMQNAALRFLRDGTLTEATISKRDVVTAKSTTYYLTYNYQAGATSCTTQSAVTKEFYDTMEIGATLPILYLPSNPKKATPVANLDGVML